MTHTTVRACCERYPSDSGVKAETREPAGEAVGRGVCLLQCFALVGFGQLSLLTSRHKPSLGMKNTYSQLLGNCESCSTALSQLLHL